MNALSILQVQGTAVPIEGNDVDTDRIIPARFLKDVTFEKMGEYLFCDARVDAQGRPTDHPLNCPQYAGASIMIVQNNFGCGSSREHAPQSIKRAGFNAIIGESFAEIFSGNCKALGIVTIELNAGAILDLIKHIQACPKDALVVDVASSEVSVGDAFKLHGRIKASHQRAFLDGTWDELSVLKLASFEIDKRAKELPYFNW